MNKRPLAGCALAYCGGIWAASVRAWYAYAAPTLLMAALFLSFLFGHLSSASSGGTQAASGSSHQNQIHMARRLPRGAVLIMVSFFVFYAAGYALCLQAESDSRWYEAYDLDDASVTATGTIYAIEEEDGVQTVRIRDVILSYDGASYRANRVLIRTYYEGEEDRMPSFEDLKIGSRIRVTGTVSYFSEARNPGNFDAREYYRLLRIDFRITPRTVQVTGGRINRYAGVLRSLKKRISSVFEECLGEDAYGVLRTIVLGDDASLSGETETLYQEAGISHILAISGLHVSIVGMLLYNLLRTRGVSWLMSSLPAFFLVLSFCVMSGMGIAARRALIMFCVRLGANLFGWAYDSLSALSLAAIVLLSGNPLLLFTASFQLSFAAVLGTSLLFPALTSFFRIRGTYAQSFMLSFSIQLATIPVTLYYYYEIPVFSLISNFILVPFVSVLLVDGICGGLIGLICLPAARIILAPGALILQGYAFFCGLIARIPGHMLICGRPSAVRIVLYYALLALMLFCLGKCPPREKGSSSARRRSVRGLFAGAGTVLLLLFMVLRVPVSFEITMLDVGQGDGILISSEGTQVFLDGGSSDVTDVGTWRIEPYLKSRGIGAIDLWIVTHTDSDHISGLEDLLSSGYRIRTLAFAAGVYRDEDLSALCALASANGTQVIYLKQGAQVSAGGVQWTVLFPEDENSYTDKNDASLVLLLRYGDFTALFTGDLTQEAEADLLSERVLARYLTQSERSAGIDLIKTAHHGSKYSSSEEFLEAVSPHAAIISAGVDNLYGHPSEETLIRLREYTDEIYVTSEAGAITIRLREGVMRISTFLDSS